MILGPVVVEAVFSSVNLVGAVLVDLNTGVVGIGSLLFSVLNVGVKGDVCVVKSD